MGVLFFLSCLDNTWSTYDHFHTFLQRLIQTFELCLNITYVEFHLVSTSKLKWPWVSNLTFSTYDRKESVLKAEDLTYFSTSLTWKIDSFCSIRSSFRIKFRIWALHLTCKRLFYNIILFQSLVLALKCVIAALLVVALSNPINMPQFLWLSSHLYDLEYEKSLEFFFADFIHLLSSE